MTALQINVSLEWAAIHLPKGMYMVVGIGCSAPVISITEQMTTFLGEIQSELLDSRVSHPGCPMIARPFRRGIDIVQWLKQKALLNTPIPHQESRVMQWQVTAEGEN